MKPYLGKRVCMLTLEMESREQAGRERSIVPLDELVFEGKERGRMA